jgi:hypothetical protein
MGKNKISDSRIISSRKKVIRLGEVVKSKVREMEGGRESEEYIALLP